MGLIVVNAKVRLIHETDLEDIEKYEAMGTSPPGQWVWRELAIHTDDIKNLIRYNSKKTLILGYYNDYTLVREPFEKVFEKWDTNKESNVDFGDESTEDETFEEEDED
jgi:hypothetical protein